jgi:hypothetical protein
MLKIWLLQMGYDCDVDRRSLFSSVHEKSRGDTIIAHNDVPLVADPPVGGLAVDEGQKFRVILHLVTSEKDSVSGLSGVLDCSAEIIDVSTSKA